MGMGPRLAQLRKEKGYTREEFAEILGISKYTLRNYELDVTDPGHTFLKQMSDFFNVSADYLVGLTDEKEKYSSYQLKTSEIDHIKKYRALDSHGQETVNIVLDRETARVESLLEKDNRIAELEASPAAIIEMPRQSFRTRHITEYFRDASAGSGIFILGNEAASQIAISDSDWDDRVDFVIQVNGDSMAPDYIDGDNVMVSQHIELNHGDIGIFVVNGNAYIKEYGETELLSHNPKHPNIPIHEFDNIVCMGKVIGKLEGEYEIIGE